MFLGSVSACVEKDLKKVVAMSTLSQLGLMFFRLSVGLKVLCFYHLVLHAFFKSILFMGVGSLMGSFFGKQDSRFYGGRFSDSFGFVYLLVRVLSMVGFPFMSGFYSKDFVILGGGVFSSYLFFLLFFFSCCFTSFYRVRLMHESYAMVNMGGGVVSFVESFYFYFPVLVRFFVTLFFGWVSHFIVLDVFLFVGVFDYLLGFLSLMGGVFFYFYLSFFYWFYFLFGSLFFLGWYSMGGVSGRLFSFFLHEEDYTWMELLGAGGVRSAFSVSFPFYYLGLVGFKSRIYFMVLMITVLLF
jgi:NADH-ubiquinone oxidoreductase chain 5